MVLCIAFDLSVETCGKFVSSIAHWIVRRIIDFHGNYLVDPLLTVVEVVIVTSFTQIFKFCTKVTVI